MSQVILKVHQGKYHVLKRKQTESEPEFPNEAQLKVSLWL